MSKDLLEKLKLAGCRCESFESQAAVIAMLEEALAEAKEEARDNVVAHVVAPPQFTAYLTSRLRRVKGLS